LLRIDLNETMTTYDHPTVRAMQEDENIDQKKEAQKRAQKRRKQEPATDLLARKVWLVSGNTSCEADDVVAAYELESDAYAEVARLSALLRQQPSWPAVEDSDAAWDSYDRKRVRWMRKFPYTALAFCGGFSCSPLPLHGARSGTKGPNDTAV
jgi:hypothetical protein